MLVKRTEEARAGTRTIFRGGILRVPTRSLAQRGSITTIPESVCTSMNTATSTTTSSGTVPHLMLRLALLLPPPPPPPPPPLLLLTLPPPLVLLQTHLACCFSDQVECIMCTATEHHTHTGGAGDDGLFHRMEGEFEDGAQNVKHWW